MPSDTISSPDQDLVWTSLAPPTPRAGLIARPDLQGLADPGSMATLLDEIGGQLSVSVSTIRTQVQAIYRKLESSSRPRGGRPGPRARPDLT